MTKVKEKLYEHRFGLFFFVFLLSFSFFLSGDMKIWKVDDITFSFHVVDFSIGFCTKLLPGAICNFLFGEPSMQQVSIYLTVLIIICFFFVGILLGKIYNRAEKEQRFPLFIIILFFLSGPGTFAVYTHMFCWLDFYWIFAAVLSILCLQNKHTYILVIPCMLFAVMSHFASILCYVPFVAIFMLYKISNIKEKKEKVLLWIIWWILVVTTIGLSLYMAVYEVENVNMSMEEMNALLASRGVKDFKYYDFSFFRDEAADKMTEYYTEETIGVILNIDMTQSPIKILFDMVIQQIKINLYVSTLKEDIPNFIMLSPVVVFIYRELAFVFKKNSENKLKRFSIFCSGALFFVSLFFGLLFSTDTMRWISHAVTPLFTFFLYTFFKEGKEIKEGSIAIFNKLPEKTVLLYLVIYAVSVYKF